jgi:hypothetical protein
MEPHQPPFYTTGARSATMPAMDDAAILRRAKEMAARDGFAWEIRGIRIARQRPVLDAARRREYLTRAREQLLNKSEKSE